MPWRWRLRGFVPAVAAISHPFWLDGFHASVDGAPWLAVVLLLGAFAVPALGIALASPVVHAEPRAISRWRIVHGATAALILLYIAFHIVNHLFPGLAGATTPCSGSAKPCIAMPGCSRCWCWRCCCRR